MESLDSALPRTEAKQRQSYKSDDVAPSFPYIKSTLSTRSLHSLPLLFDCSNILLLFPHFPPPSNNFTKLLAQLRRRFFYKVTPPTSPHPQTWTVCPSLGPNSARCCPAITRLRLYQNCSFKCLSPPRYEHHEGGKVPVWFITVPALPSLAVYIFRDNPFPRRYHNPNSYWLRRKREFILLHD